MARVKRGGRELVIADSEVTEYLKNGYSVIDEHGNEMTPAKAVTYNQVLNENAVLKKRVEALSKQLEAASREITDLKAALKKQSEKAENAPEPNTTAEHPVESTGNTLEQRQTVQANKSTPGAKTAQKGGKKA